MRHSFSRFPPIRSAALAASLVAAGSAVPATAQAQGGAIEIRLVGDSLVAPRDFTAGTVIVRFETKKQPGNELHLFRVPLGVEPDEFIARLRGASPGHVDVLAAGGPVASRDTALALATLDLRQGRYVAVATPAGSGTFPSGRGRYAVLSGVTKFAVVSPGLVLDGTITLSDRDIRVSNAMRTGWRRVKVHNAGSGQHGVLVVRPKPGRSRADALEWLRTGKGARPFDWMGGVTPMSSGRDAWLDLVLDPGEYTLLCVVRGRDGRTHADAGAYGTLVIR